MKVRWLQIQNEDSSFQEPKLQYWDVIHSMWIDVEYAICKEEQIETCNLAYDWFNYE